jgi:endonuclease G, mitochondrial
MPSAERKTAGLALCVGCPTIWPLDDFRVFQISLPELEARTGVRFPAALRASDIRAELADVDRRSPLQDTDDIRW